MQAYGWSLPANKPQGSGSVASTPTSEDSTSSSRIGANVPVPVPVYCRPLMEKEPGMKVSNFFCYLNNELEKKFELKVIDSFSFSSRIII